jgi:hypothetical protein
MSSSLKNRVDRLSSWARGGTRVAAILYRCERELENDDIAAPIGSDNWFPKAIAEVTDRELAILHEVIEGWHRETVLGLSVEPEEVIGFGPAEPRS